MTDVKIRIEISSPTVGPTQIALLQKWDSVRNSVRNSVWASVRDLVWASVGDYEHFDELSDGDVVDVEFILGETTVKKVSERLTIHPREAR